MVPTKEQFFILAPNLLKIWEDQSIPYFTRDSVKYLYDLIVFNDTPDVIHRKIKDLSDFELLYLSNTKIYSVLYNVVFGSYEDLPTYINYEGYNTIINWRLKLSII
jgi:hypothetical protein